MDARRRAAIEALIAGKPEPTAAEIAAEALSRVGFAAWDVEECLDEDGASITVYRFEDGEV